jgi:uncharacterized membrane protein YjjP (DUF1212 family)
MSLQSELSEAFTRVGAELKARTPKLYKTSTNVTSSSNVAANIAGLVFTATTGKSYLVKFIANIQTANTNTGVRIGLTGTAGGTFAGSFRGSITNAAAATELVVPISGLGSVLLTTAVIAINSPHCVSGDFVVHATATGTIQMTFASEVNGTLATLLNGASLIVQEF